MARIHLTDQDLLRTRIAGGPDPAVELTYSLRALREPVGPALRGWRGEVSGRLASDTRELFDRVPLIGHPILLTPADAPAYHRIGVAPFWRWVCTLIEADRALRGRTLQDEGLDRLLRSLHPTIRLDGPILEFPGTGGTELDGRGLLLQPSVFLWRHPVLHEHAGRPALVYPAFQEWAGRCDPGPLGALVGRSRALMLAALSGSGSTTTELAHRLELSLAAASQHTSILRSAGLITTQLVRGARFHALTPVGAALLADPTAEPGEPGWVSSGTPG